jgi:hypothetical protein
VIPVATSPATAGSGTDVGSGEAVGEPEGESEGDADGDGSEGVGVGLWEGVSVGVDAPALGSWLAEHAARPRTRAAQAVPAITRRTEGSFPRAWRSR